MIFEFLILFISFFAGLIGALVGLGGGVIITPVLVLGFGINIKYAMGAALISVIATSSGAAAAYLKEAMSNVKIAIFLSIATTLGAILGAYCAVLLNIHILSIIFGTVLLITALISVLNKTHEIPPDTTSSALAIQLELPNAMPDPKTGKSLPYAVTNIVPGFIVMMIAGLLSGLLGIGSGAFKVLGMDQIMNIPFKVTTATSNFMIGLTAAASVGIYLKSGFFDPILSAPIAIGILIGAIYGAKLSKVIPIGPLKTIFLVLITLIGFQMILKGFGIEI